MEVEAVVPCRPVKDELCTWIPPGYQYRKPQIRDTIKQCNACGCDIWASPGKIAAVESGRFAEFRCWPCVQPLWEEANGVIAEVVVQPGRVDNPRC